MKLYDVQFDPSDYGIVQKYDEVKSIYKMDLSPTIITLTTNIDSGEVSTQETVKRTSDIYP